MDLLNNFLKVSYGTQAQWEATTLPIPEGVMCFESDTLNAKIGNGTDLYTNLNYALDAIPEEIKLLIQNSVLVQSNENNIIPTELFPKDVFNIHTVVYTIEDRDLLDIEIVRNSQLVLVIDASGDPSVTSGMAFYVADFIDETTYEWIKVGEQESIDLDFSSYLTRTESTLDDIADSETYTRLTSADLDLLDTSITSKHSYIIEFFPYTNWNDPTTQYLVAHIKGYDTGTNIVDETGGTITVSGVTISSNAEHVHNNKTSLYFPNSSAYIRFANTLPNFGTGDYTVSFWAKMLHATATGNIYQNTYSNSGNKCFHALYGSSKVFYARLGSNTSNYETDFPRSSANDWVFYSVSRKSGIGYIHINGTMKRSYTHNVNYTGPYSYPLSIGYYNSSFIGMHMAMQDFRMYSGYSLYDSGNYTPPLPV